MKADRKIYKGIEYVQFSELPPAQQEQILQTLSPDLFIKIMIDGTIVSRCIQYKDYSNWFNASFVPKQSIGHVQKAVTEKIQLDAALALDKI